MKFLPAHLRKDTNRAGLRWIESVTEKPFIKEGLLKHKKQKQNLPFTLPQDLYDTNLPFHRGQ